MLSLSLFSQTPKANIPVDEETGLITWQDVIQVQGTKDSLYVRAIEWINATYKNAQEVTRIRDQENGKIVVQHRIAMFDTLDDGQIIKSNTVVNYVLRLEFKEDRYRYTFTEFTMKAQSKFPLERWLNPSDAMYTPVWEGYLIQVEVAVLDLIKSLKEGMKPKIKKEDVW